jgi:ATP-dependent DNA helicase RecG
MIDLMMNREDQTSETKRTVDDPAGIAKTVCSFANTKGGDIWIGLADDGDVVGVEEDELDRTQLQLSNGIRIVQPIPRHEITVEKIDGKEVVHARIFPLSDDRFCSFKGLIYYRSGSSNLKLEGTSLHDFLVKRRVIEFDMGPTSAGLDDVAPDKVRSFLKARSPALVFDEAMMARYLIRLEAAYEGGPFHLNNAGALFFTKRPNEFIARNDVRCVRFKGTLPIDIVDQKTINDTIPESIEYCQEFISRHTTSGVKIEGMRRRDIPEYPEEVLREATVNSFAHRDYFNPASIQINVFDDRIEWVNPIVLPEGMTVDNLNSVSIPRNPLIYRFLRDLGYIEGLGTGLPRIRSSLKMGGFPDPVLEQIGPLLRLTIFSRARTPEAAEMLNERQSAFLNGMKSGDIITSGQYAERFGISRPTAVKELNDLCALGLLKIRGRGPSTRYDRTAKTVKERMIN